MSARRLPLSVLVGLGLLLVGSAHAGEPTARIDYSRDIQPILSENCFACHGPDAGTRKAGLRLDHKVDAFAELESGSRALVAGEPDESELIFRIEEPDPSLHMPPPKSGKSLKPEQVALIREWVEQGASWSEHWAFVPPHRPELPRTSESPWVNNPIDAFILERLNREGLAPSPEADRVTLIRRLSLDLIGLPPTPQEVEAFVNDRAPGAYERLVDRLLDSPHYGERWARFWLDAARYADSDGYEKDKPRFVWFYRDWVINALNNDKPYDQFIIEQIAGDLLPDATQDQKVATGFLRNSMINEEGGANPEQFRMEAMYDRMDAIGKGILGLTISCAQCHTHKFDPLTHTEYYQMFAFLNNSDEGSIAVYTPEDQAKRAGIFRQIHDLEADLQAQAPDWESRMASWEDAQAAEPATTWEIVRPELDESGGQKHDLLADGSVLASGYAPTKHTTSFTARTDLTTITAVRLELLNDPNLPLGGPGRSLEGLCALTEFRVSAAPADNPGEARELKIVRATADVNPDEAPLAAYYDDRSDRERVTGPVSYAIDGDDLTAWSVDIGDGRSNVPHQAVFTLEEPVTFPKGAILTFRLTQNHGGWNSDDNQNNNLGRFRFAVTDQAGAVADPVPDAVRQALAVPRAERTPEQLGAIFSYWRTTQPDWRATNERIEALWKKHPVETSQLVLLEREIPRETHRLDRGDFLKPAEVVEPGVPAFLNPLPADAPRTRLSFARWLVDRESPTTARAIVNRVWQAELGRGIVATSEDFGLQGEPPSHPELLDWLAVEFMENGWSLKALQRLIVTSATYRQGSAITSEALERDPDNRLLARGPRFRVSAETIRDIALAVSGLLNPEVGGPSVCPPAPEFLFEPPASYGPKVWKVAEGPERYRRALYTFRYRSVPYPMLQAFDAPNGDVSCVRRSRSNTPLQALTGLNEPVFLECARALALRTLREAPTEESSRLAFAFRCCVARSPNEAETEVLRDLLHRQTQRFSAPDANPWDLAANDPNTPPALPEGVQPADAAAWTAVARVLLNLDETITKD